MLRIVDEAITRAVERRRSARYAARRRRRQARIMVWVSASSIILAFAAGFVWRSGWLRPPAASTATIAVGDTERAEAYRLFDEAVRARHEERLQGAFNAINEARRLHSDLPGLDLFIGEIALEQGEPRTLQQAARESLRRGHNESAAKLLLALDKWMSRNPQGTVSTGASVSELLAEAADASPSSAAALFFHGEVARLAGDPATAHRKLLGALHRQTAWSGASFLAKKLQVAAAEASERGRPVLAAAPDEASQALLDLREAVASGRDMRPAFGELLSSTPSLQAKVLLQDQTFQRNAVAGDIRVLQEQLDVSVPKGALEL